VIYNGRPAAYFVPPHPTVRHHLRQQFGIPSEAVVCFTSARMDFVKGYQHQIEAIKQLRQSDIWPRLYFVWAGAGSVESRVRAMAMKINADSHIKFLGERPDVAELLDVADMFILPSHWEGMPLSIMEAMAKGLPVMATAISGVPEELGTTGKLLPDPEVNPNATVEEMAVTIRSWATDVQLRRQIGGACRQRAEEHFRAERMIADYLRIVADLLPSHALVGAHAEAVS
jgi:glycosyltransferase involved in cell wall biosynthesis